MKNRLDLALQQVAEKMPLCYKLGKNLLGSCSRLIRLMIASAQVSVLVLPLLFVSLFILPATPAYAERGVDT